jgi:hypothetical protein
MPTSTFKNDLTNWNRFNVVNLKALSTFLLVFTLLFSQTAFSQTPQYATVGQSLLNCTRGDDACPANDLQVLDLFIGEAGKCLTCEPGKTVTADLFMRINNTTGSVRTSFALFGNLSAGASIQGISGKIFICVGPINITKGINTFKVGQITFTCGQSLSLTDNYLAYTPANSTPEAACAVFAKATDCKDLSPKCGVSASITIRTPVTGTASTVTEPCVGTATGGSIKVTPSGGEGAYTIDVFKKGTGACATTAPAKTAANGYVTTLTVTPPATSATTAATLAPGDYCIYVTDGSTLKCQALVTHTIAGKPCCVNPPKPIVCEVPQSNLCPDLVNGVTIKVSNLQANAYYIVKQAGKADKVQQAPATVTSSTKLTFTGLVSGLGFTVYGEDRTSEPFCKGAEADCDDITVCEPEPALTSRNLKAEIQTVTESQTKVTAAPNPFNDKIRFSLQSNTTGRGSLELYNMLGQKVKTVFEGQVQKGQLQTIEYSVPGTQRSNLIYLFRVGNERVSGKLIGIK